MRNSFAGVFGYCDILHQGIADKDPPEKLYQYLEGVKRAGFAAELRSLNLVVLLCDDLSNEGSCQASIPHYLSHLMEGLFASDALPSRTPADNRNYPLSRSELELVVRNVIYLGWEAVEFRSPPKIKVEELSASSTIKVPQPQALQLRAPQKPFDELNDRELAFEVLNFMVSKAKGEIHQADNELSITLTSVV